MQLLGPHRQELISDGTKRVGCMFSRRCFFCLPLLAWVDAGRQNFPGLHMARPGFGQSSIRVGAKG